MKLCEKILMLRKKAGLSQEEMAEKLGVSRQAVSRWEGGSAQPDASNVLQLSKLFSVTADYLLNDDYESDSDIPAVRSVTRAAGQRLHRLAGAGVGTVGLLTNFIIYLLSRFIRVPAPLKTYDPVQGITTYHFDGVLRVDYGFFLQEYRLQALVIGAWILTAVGLVLLLRNTPVFRELLGRFGRKSKGELEYDASREKMQTEHPE